MVKQAPVETAAQWCYLPLAIAALAWVVCMVPFLGTLGMILMFLAMWLAYTATGIAIGAAVIAMMQNQRSIAGTAAVAAVLNWLLLHGMGRTFFGF